MEASVIASKGAAGFTFEDVVIGAMETSSGFLVTEAEIMSFAGRYDPLPIHIDQEAAASGPFGVLTASGAHMIAIRMRLVHDFTYGGGVIAAVGLDEVRFLAALRANQVCKVESEFLEKRESTKRVDRGVVTIRQSLLADGAPVLTLKDIVLMRRRPAGHVQEMA
jgi:acyl dehydratase